MRHSSLATLATVRAARKIETTLLLNAVREIMREAASNIQDQFGKDLGGKTAVWNIRYADDTTLKERLGITEQLREASQVKGLQKNSIKTQAVTVHGNECLQTLQLTRISN
ncbi:uncharacterized protein LOC125040545 [Penaeus chinensis]|uniref:uncharacterized protein LOC125040545 n=1 Tax=Penaeus chinensis TaxID=139456 RepID=UPI001FB78F88|nr:uncharacterized protein LOC125040545 [Penaeus chinensis]